MPPITISTMLKSVDKNCKITFEVGGYISGIRDYLTLQGTSNEPLPPLKDPIMPFPEKETLPEAAFREYENEELETLKPRHALEQLATMEQATFTAYFSPIIGQAQFDKAFDDLVDQSKRRAMEGRK